LRTNRSIAVYLDKDRFVIAVFEADAGNKLPVVINEINYHSSPECNTEDWLELFNYGGENVDISGWMIKDSDDSHSFLLPTNTILPARHYAVVCRDTSALKSFFPSVKNCLGNLNFGLSSSGELIRLFDASGSLVDSVTYRNSPPWPVEPDGAGFTLALKDAKMSNSDPASWFPSSNHGTPGRQNDFQVQALDISGLVQAPRNFRLYQNFPNPFNGETVIPFELPFKSHVLITILSIEGKVVYMAMNKELAPGEHLFKWRPENAVPSGLYFVRINPHQGQTAQANKEKIATTKVLYIK
jgi:hypothetical protein